MIRRGKHQARRQRSKELRRFGRAMPIALVVSLLMTATALADNTAYDGDDVTLTGDRYSLDLGEVCALGSVNVDVDVFANRNGSASPGINVFQNSATVTFSVVSAPAEVLATLPAAPGNQVTLPSNWTTSSNNTQSSHIVANLTYTAGSTLGPVVGSVTFRGSGLGVPGATINRDRSLNLTADVIDCSGPTNTAPTITSAGFAADVDCRVESTLDVSFTDPDASDTHTATVDWGDGSSVENLGTVTNPFSASHIYNVAGMYTATVTVSDGTESDSETADITVNQVYAVTSFMSPLDSSSSGAIVKNTFKNGRVVPIKATIQDGCTFAPVDGTSGLTPTVELTKTPISGGGSDAVEFYADAGASSGNTDEMRWADGHWIYNMDSKVLKLATGSGYRMDIYIDSIRATNATWVVLAPTK